MHLFSVLVFIFSLSFSFKKLNSFNNSYRLFISFLSTKPCLLPHRGVSDRLLDEDLVAYQIILLFFMRLSITNNLFHCPTPSYFLHWKSLCGVYCKLLSIDVLIYLLDFVVPGK